MIYFIRTVPMELVKIGCAMGGRRALLNRLASLQTGCPLRLWAVAAIPGTIREERALHLRFHAYHERGEWFRIEGELADLIEAHAFKRPLSIPDHVPKAVEWARRQALKQRPEPRPTDRAARMRGDRWHAADALFED